jgi:glutathione S-transferase
MSFLTKNHAFPLFAFVSIAFVDKYLGIEVGQARKKYGINYPLMYESPDFEGKLKTPFNNYQRAHQNMVENLPTFYTALAAGSIFNPVVAGICGITYAIGRIIYAKGYQMNPEKRYYGEVLTVPAEMTLYFQIIRGAIKLLKK